MSDNTSGPYITQPAPGPDEQDLEKITISQKPGRTPTQDEAAFALKVQSSVNQISQSDVSLSERKPYVEEIVGAFQSCGVATSQPVIGQAQLNDALLRFSQEKLHPIIDGLINKAMGSLGVAAIASILLAAISWNYRDTGSPDADFVKVISVFAFLHIGLLSGRFLDLFIRKSEFTSSMPQYRASKAELQIPLMGVAVDAVIAFVSVIIFMAQFMVITIGGGVITTESGETVAQPILSTANIANDWKVAIGFGILIGLSRSVFLVLLKRFSASSLRLPGSKDPD